MRTIQKWQRNGPGLFPKKKIVSHDIAVQTWYWAKGPGKTHTVQRSGRHFTYKTLRQLSTTMNWSSVDRQLSEVGGCLSAPLLDLPLIKI